MNPAKKLTYERLRSIKLDWTTYLLLRQAAILDDRTLAGQIRWMLKRCTAGGAGRRSPKRNKPTVATAT